MSFLAEMLAVAVVWLSSFALCQFGVVVDHAVCPHDKGAKAKIVSRTPRETVIRPTPVAVMAPPNGDHEA